MQKTRMFKSTDRPTSTPAAWLAISLTVVTVILLAALHLASPEFDPSWRRSVSTRSAGIPGYCR
jgi:hypothetical protein